MKRIFCLCLLAILVFPQPGRAAGSDNLMLDVFVLEPISLTERMEEESLNKSTAIVTVKNPMIPLTRMASWKSWNISQIGKELWEPSGKSMSNSLLILR